MTTLQQPVTAFLCVAFSALAVYAASPTEARAQSYGASLAVGQGEVFVGEPATTGQPGTVYVYAAGEGGEWSEVGRLTAPEPAVGDRFGQAIAHLDGHLLLGGTAPTEETGALFVFRKDAGGWRFDQRVRPDDLRPEDGFGSIVAARSQVAAVGAPTSEAGGAAYVLRRSEAGRWSVEAKLVSEDLQSDDLFGGAVSVGEDVVVVGAPRKNRGAGAAYVFGREAASGEWTQIAKLLPEDLERGYGFGATALVDGDHVLIGAPGFGRRTGAVYVFSRDEATGQWEEAGKLLPFDGPRFALFGTDLEALGNEVWVGAPLAGGREGRIYRIRWDPEAGAWASASTLATGDAEEGDGFGGSLGVSGGLAVVSLSGDDYGAGTAAIFELAGDDWAEAGKVWSEVEGLEAVTGGERECTEGTAAAFDCSGVDLLSFLPVRAMGAARGVRTNDVWGWTDPQTGREYALVGMTDQTAFVNVTDPEEPVYLGRLPMTEGAEGSTWRDIKVYKDHAFIVSDGAGEHGMQVFDLTRLREADDGDDGPVDFGVDARYDRIHSAHNIVIDPESGYAYSVGSSGGGETCGGGLHMIDIREPTRPTFAGCFADPATGRQRTGYTHDAQCVIYRGPDEEHRGREICLGANETALSIADVTDKENPVPLAVATYPNVGYTHQGWLTEDHRYFFMDDELDELQGKVERTRTLVWDVADLDDPVLVKEFFGTTPASDHNLYVRGNLVYQSNYQAGLRILDIGDPENPREVAWFDTVPFGENTAGFGGSWSNYPFFPSENVIVTSGRQGLFVVRKSEPRLVP